MKFHMKMKRMKIAFAIISLIVALSSCRTQEEQTYIGYIISLEDNSLNLNPFEFITANETERANELGLTQDDMPNGYYIYDEDDEILNFTLEENVEFHFYDTQNLFVSKDDDKGYATDNISEFILFLYGDSDTPRRSPFIITVKDGKVVSIREKFVN